MCLSTHLECADKLSLPIRAGYWYCRKLMSDSLIINFYGTLSYNDIIFSSNTYIVQILYQQESGACLCREGWTGKRCCSGIAFKVAVNVYVDSRLYP